MNTEKYANQMSHNANSVRAMTEWVSDEQARWKPNPESWSILEVVNHLYDEEREDFRVRLDYILHRPGEDPPGIDPGGWVTARAYNERELRPSLDNYLREREASLIWLRGLDSPDWNAAYAAPFGKITAGDMFAAWVAHDLLHLRQLVELHYAYTAQSVRPHQVTYAGEW